VTRSALWPSAAYVAVLACNPVPQDGGGGFTGDNDKISDAVELNPANSFHNFSITRDDLNPSQARGLPNGGTLYMGINLPDDHAGYHHHYGVPQDMYDKDDWGTLAIINRIEGVAADWIDVLRPCIDARWNPTPPPRFSVGDLSKGDAASRQFGGYWSDHPQSHQNGLDMDLRFARTDNSLEGLELGTPSGAFYDPGATADLMYCFLYYTDVTLLLVDMELAQIDFGGDPRVQHRSDHRDHWHVRIRDPDGANLRVNQLSGP
jgi:hypothetical protein